MCAGVGLSKCCDLTVFDGACVFKFAAATDSS